MLNRRSLLLSAAAVPAVLSLPLPAAIASPGRWYAVGNDELVYPYWARSLKEAALEYANEHGARLGDECPECGDIECREHIAPKNWNEPQGWVEAVAPKSWSAVPPDRDPTMTEWINAGYNVPCEECDYGEPEECYVFEGRAVCTECLEHLRSAKLDRIIGNEMPCGWREPLL